ncbi:MAG: peptidoglycan DL-endopeptidase CwlO [Actinomycetota bacterium]|jgi:cell wall-associated NlpC family hydrolase|nr:peptidoglycan DL-endopeptidase CwlO [Actinomycetota bacterium]
MSRPTAIGALIGALALFVPTIVTALPASGDPISDKQAEATRIQRQLEAQSERVSILAEDYDEARVQVATIEQQLQSSQAKVATTDAQAGEIRGRLKAQAVAAYVRGGSSQAIALLADAKRTDDLAVRGQYVRTVTSGAADVLDELKAVRMQLDEQRAALDAARADARQSAALAESKRRAAATAEAEQKATLAKVQGELGALVAAEAKRRAEAEAKRVQAELAAKKARDAAASAAAAARNRPSTATPSGTTRGAAPTGSAVAGSTATGPPAAGADAAVAEAKRQIGKPYQYGSPGPDSFDCSGLTSFAWRAGGKSLPHSSRAQWSATSRVAIGDVQPGDILFYGNPIHHVGIYVGDGQMVEASETGVPVRYASIYRRDLVGAGRVN